MMNFEDSNILYSTFLSDNISTLTLQETSTEVTADTGDSSHCTTLILAQGLNMPCEYSIENDQQLPKSDDFFHQDGALPGSSCT